MLLGYSELRRKISLTSESVWRPRQRQLEALATPANYEPKQEQLCEHTDADRAPLLQNSSSCLRSNC